VADLTDRATAEEKAEAWDMLMRAKGGESLALTEAWCFLRDLVEAREAHEQRMVDLAREYGQDADNVIGAARLAADRRLRVVSDR
jgi:hypothetical protein